MTALAGAGRIPKVAERGPVFGARLRRFAASAAPVVVVFGILIGMWYIASIYYNLGALRTYYSNIGAPGVWNRMTTLQQWGAALNAQAPTLPAPHQVMANLWSRLDESDTAPFNLWADLRTTAIEAVFGFVIGSIASLILAYLFVRSRVLELSLFPYVVMSQTIPIIALVPALVVILQVGFQSKVVVAAYLTFYPVTMSAVKGLRSVDPLGEELMRSYAASGRQTFLKLRLPSSLPYLFTGLKIGITASLIGAIVSELPTGSQTGLGVSILGASSSGLTINLWATIVACGLLGLLMYGVIVATESLVVRAKVGQA
jgi:NitT/TauT family transport system permease protein